MGRGKEGLERGGKERRRRKLVPVGESKKTEGQIRISSRGLRRGDVIARILLDKYLTFETIHYFANEQSELLFHPFFPRVEITFRTMILT